MSGRSARFRRVAPVFAAVLAVAWLAGAASAAPPPARKPAKKAAAKPAPPPEPPKPPEAPPPDPGGVHVLTGAPPKDIRDYPLGVTVLGRPAPQRSDVIRVQVEPSPPDPRLPVPRPEGPPVAFVPPGFTPAPHDPFTAPITIGPGLDQQVGVFGRATAPAGRSMADTATWRPTPAYPPGDPQHPYPWNPAGFSSPTFDPTFHPTPAWPAGQDLRSWSPVTWSDRTIDSSWEPHDAWGRQVAAPPPPLPPPEPRPQPPPPPPAPGE